MANRKNSGKQRKQQNSSRPASRSSSTRYQGDYRREIPRTYDDREYADYRRSYTRSSGSSAGYTRYEEDGYSRRSTGYSGRGEYDYRRDYAPERDRTYRTRTGYDDRRYYEDRLYEETRRSSGSRSRSQGRGTQPRRGGDPGRKDPSRRSSSRKTSSRQARQRGSRRGGRPVRIKKRFYFFVILLILLIAVGGYFGVRALVNDVIPSVMDRIHGTETAGQVEEDTEVKETKSGDKISDYDSVTMERMILDDLGTPDTQIKVINSGSTEEGEEGEGDTQQSEAAATDENTIDLAKLPMEERIRAAVLSSWYISPLGQDRATIEESFGVLNKYEDWAGGIYYHKGFPDSMYIMYKGKNGADGMPREDAVCVGVSVALEQILEFETFSPNEKWGAMHKDNGDFGWRDYYYSILIQKGINLIVYCEDDGSVNQQTHILVRQVQ